jgi:hypothetical protein
MVEYNKTNTAKQPTDQNLIWRANTPPPPHNVVGLVARRDNKRQQRRAVSSLWDSDSRIIDTVTVGAR